MTGGRVVILGNTGKNFAAGMSGGIVYVLDEKHDLYTRLNKTGLEMSTLQEHHDIQELQGLIREHVTATGSEKGRQILEHFEEYIPAFKKIIPKDYEKMIALADIDTLQFVVRTGKSSIFRWKGKSGSDRARGA